MFDFKVGMIPIVTKEQCDWMFCVLSMFFTSVANEDVTPNSPFKDETQAPMFIFSWICDAMVDMDSMEMVVVLLRMCTMPTRLEPNVAPERM